MKKIENIEKNIYEILGVNVFRKYVLFTWEKLAKLIHLNVGYRVKKLSIKEFKFYKIRAIIFAAAHFAVLVYLSIHYIFNPTDIFHILLNYLLNGYCIMVQRYNTIRINQLLKKNEIRCEKQKEIVKEKLRENDLSLDEHTYTMVDNNYAETSVTFEELISNASIEQLQLCLDYLIKLKKRNEENEYFRRNKIGTSIPIAKNKILELEFIDNKKC